MAEGKTANAKPTEAEPTAGKRLIDRLRGEGGALDRDAVRAILPYGDDFLFVDRVERLEARKIETVFRIPDHAPYLDGHFRGLPVMPGALMSEAVNR